MKKYQLPGAEGVAVKPQFGRPSAWRSNPRRGHLFSRPLARLAKFHAAAGTCIDFGNGLVLKAGASDIEGGFVALAAAAGVNKPWVVIDAPATLLQKLIFWR
ncbi:hypothetical protein [Leifsonia xyli]|uniref:hypothetical protein n=1 Tax=Leifsonia xyli TaxID=1575 RepID=UPI003D67E827